MNINYNSLAISSYRGVRQATDALYSSMRRLSSGSRLDRPGDNPADYGVSETLRFQIHNSDAAKRNIENARYLVSSADSWLQTSGDILRRMQELSISAVDGSKSDLDRQNLDVEFQQLKQELGRISREARYNGVQVAGRDQMLSYDADKKTFFFSQLDGGETYTLNVKVQSGLQADNSLDFMYDPANDFTQSADGQHIFYVDSADNVVKYEIETGTLSRDTTDTNSKAFDVDETGRLWYATETAPASGVYTLRQQNVDTWTQDTTLIGPGDITDMGSTEFAVHSDRVYYLNSGGDIVSRSLHSPGDVNVELASSDLTFTTTAGQFALSQDGLYMADVSAPGIVRITNMETEVSSTIAVAGGVTVDDLTFGVDSNELMYRNSVNGEIRKIDVTLGDSPILSNDVQLHKPTGATGYSGLSLDGGSHRAHFRVHTGPDAVQQSFLTTGDVRINVLGLSRTRVDSIESAKVALGQLQTALDNVTVQRAAVGAEVSRIDHAYESIARYQDEIEQADATIRDTDVAKESALLADLQIRQQAAIAMLAQANQTPQAVLSLLNSR